MLVIYYCYDKVEFSAILSKFFKTILLTVVYTFNIIPFFSSLLHSVLVIVAQVPKYFSYIMCVKNTVFCLTSHNYPNDVVVGEMSGLHDPQLIRLFSFLYLRLHIDWLDHSSLTMLCRKWMEGWAAIRLC